ncbi:MAG: DUF481 domain-containing protein [Verrucomicrobia bacterium]|nr:DUF481 domain-containing protein [Verrucomicrobiota bacterium]
MPHLKVRFLISALLACATIARAENTQGFESSLNAGTTLTSGNSDTLNANAGLDVRRYSGRNEFQAGSDLNYGEAEGTKVKQSVAADAQIRNTFFEKAYAYAGLDYRTDAIAEIDYRVSMGPGLGYHLISDNDVRLNVEAGSVWVLESIGETRSEDFAAWRVAETFEIRFGKSDRIWQSVSIVPEMADLENFILAIDLGVESGVTDRISMRIVFKDRINNAPAIEDGVALKKSDITIIAGFALKL